MELRLDEILAMIDKVKGTDLALFEYQDADTKIRIKGAGKTVSVCPGPQAAQFAGEFAAGGSAVPAVSGTAGNFTADGPAAVGSSAAQADGHVITSPMVGTFYAAASEKEAPFVQVGDHVEKGQTVGIVEAMKLMNEIESEWSGTVEEIPVANGQMVEFGQPLVRLAGN